VSGLAGDGLRELVATGTWTHEPEAAGFDGDVFRVTAVEGSDAWRTTSYGFVHDSEHALLQPTDGPFSVEASFVLDYTEQFDQAGVFLRVDEQAWIKAGVEFSDGAPQLGAVVTRGFSDWSVSPVPEWVGRVVTVRASRDGDAVTVRAWAEGEEPRLVPRPGRRHVRGAAVRRADAGRADRDVHRVPRGHAGRGVALTAGGPAPVSLLR